MELVRDQVTGEIVGISADEADGRWELYEFPWGTAVRDGLTGRWTHAFVRPDGREWLLEGLRVELHENGIEFLKEDPPDPVCDQDFCDACGKCLACHGDEKCEASSDGRHIWRRPKEGDEAQE